MELEAPDPEQRLKIYQIALTDVTADIEAYMCNSIAYGYDQVMEPESFYPSHRIIPLFPEFMAQQPETVFADGEIWFSAKELGDKGANEKRIQVLKKCIADVKREFNVQM